LKQVVDGMLVIGLWPISWQIEMFGDRSSTLMF